MIGRKIFQMIEANQWMEEDHYLNQLLAQLDDLTQKILEVDV